MSDKPLVMVLANGVGAFFVRCHCCHRTSPPHTAHDDLRVLAAAQTAGWIVKRVAGEYRAWCDRPTCQRQAE